MTIGNPLVNLKSVRRGDMQVVSEVNFVTEQKSVFPTISRHLLNGEPMDVCNLVDGLIEGGFVPIRIMFLDKRLGQRQIIECNLVVRSLWIKPKVSYLDRMMSLSILCGFV